MRPPVHRVTISVDGREIEGWNEYSIETSMLTPADSFSLTMPFSRAAYDLCKPDRQVRVNIDGTTVITGFVDERAKSSKAGTLNVSGRDKVGRLVDESTGAVSFSGLKLTSLFRRVVAPWFPDVVLSNARNRAILRGKGNKSRSNDRVYIDSTYGSRLEPGSTKWSVIEDVCEQAALLAWSSGDGKELVVGEPNYQQEVQFRFLNALGTSSRRSNVLDLDVVDSVADRFALIRYIGAGKGDAGTWGLATASRQGVARNNPDKDDGTGKDFKYPKGYIVSDRQGIDSIASATRRAEREMARRDMRAHVVKVTAPAHGQLLAGASAPTLFCNDTLAFVEDEDVDDIRGVYIIVATHFGAARVTGETTEMTMLRKGTVLSL